MLQAPRRHQTTIHESLRHRRLLGCITNTFSSMRCARLQWKIRAFQNNMNGSIVKNKERDIVLGRDKKLPICYNYSRKQNEAQWLQFNPYFCSLITFTLQKRPKSISLSFFNVNLLSNRLRKKGLTKNAVLMMCSQELRYTLPLQSKH